MLASTCLLPQTNLAACHTLFKVSVHIRLEHLEAVNKCSNILRTSFVHPYHLVLLLDLVAFINKLTAKFLIGHVPFGLKRHRNLNDPPVKTDHLILFLLRLIHSYSFPRNMTQSTFFSYLLILRPLRSTPPHLRF